MRLPTQPNPNLENQMFVFNSAENAIQRQILPSEAAVGDWIIRCWDGKPGKIEKITSIHAQGVSVNGHQYVCGYSDYFGDYPKSSMSFSSSSEDDGKSYRVNIFTSRQ